MQRTYIIAQEINSKPKLTKKFFLQDLFFLVAYMAVTIVLKMVVNPKLVLPYIIFSFVMAVFLTSRSVYNRKRKNFESVFILLRKDELTYKPISKTKKEK